MELLHMRGELAATPQSRTFRGSGTRLSIEDVFFWIVSKADSFGAAITIAGSPRWTQPHRFLYGFDVFENCFAGRGAECVLRALGRLRPVRTLALGLAPLPCS